MTLTTTNINRCGEKLYRKMLAGGRFSEDTCAQAYEDFVRRLRRYRERHPDASRVSPRFARNCERWLAVDLARRKKRRRVRAALELEVSRQSLAPPSPRAGSGNTFLFQKMECFFSHWVGEKPKASSYIRVFLLQNAWYLSPRRVRLFAALVDGKKSDFVKQVKTVKKYVAGKIAAAAGERLSAARYWHGQSLKNDILAREETGSRCRSLKQRQADCLQKQRRAVASLEKLKLKPPVNVLARVAGVTSDQARHACGVCLKEMKRYFS